jgi:hypothetical protein
VAHNALIVAAGGDSEAVLKQLLHEYVSFALFNAGALLGSEREAELCKQLAASVAALRPHA